MSHIGYLLAQAERRANARFEARFYGACANCDFRIKPGDILRWDDRDAVHAECPTTGDAA